jgi:Putative auto-transporter adhesin, head GIN domain
MKKIHLFYLLLSVLQFSSCSDICDCFHGTGYLVTEERALGNISGIHLVNDIDVILYESNYPKIRVTAGDKLIKDIRTREESGLLYIHNDNKCNWVRKFNPTLTVEVWTKNIHSIYADNSSGDITCVDTIHTDNFRIDAFNSLGTFRIKLDADVAVLAINNGPCDIYAEGIVKTQYNFNAGFGVLDCGKLLGDNNYVHNKGTNQIYVNSSSILEVTIGYSGNVYYKGTPGTIKKSITGSGKLIKL